MQLVQSGLADASRVIPWQSGKGQIS